jgi:hypothetical protein
MKDIYNPSSSSKKLTIPTTLTKNILIDMSRTRLHMWHGVVENKKSPNYKYLDHDHGTMYPMKRGNNFICKVPHTYSWNILMV